MLGWDGIIPVEIANPQLTAFEKLTGTAALLDGVRLPVSKALGLFFPGVSEADLGGCRRYQTSLAASSGGGFPGWRRRGGVGASCPCPHWTSRSMSPRLLLWLLVSSETARAQVTNVCYIQDVMSQTSVKNNSQSACVTNIKH